MARFDVLPRKGNHVLVVDCQADGLRHLPTRFVVPLLDLDRVPSPIGRLNPILDVAGRPMLLATHLAAAVPVSSLGRSIVSLADEHHRIIDALDFLLTGF